MKPKKINSPDELIQLQNKPSKVINLSITIENVKINEPLNFSGFTFSKNVHFKNVDFEKVVLFRNCTFKGEVTFDISRFHSDAYFNSSEFFENVFFHTNFNSFASFNKIIGKKKISFSHGRVIKEVDFSQMKLNELSISTYMLNIAIFDKSEIQKMHFDRAGFRSNGLFRDTKIESADRETFRIIKNELLRANNKIDSLFYHQKEMSELNRELSIWTDFGNKIVLFISSITNDFGLKWTRALVFFFISSSILYFLFLITLTSFPFQDTNNFLEIIALYCQFLNPVRPLSFVNQELLNHSSIIVDFVSRIIISFAIYQFLTSFRKFKI